MGSRPLICLVIATLFLSACGGTGVLYHDSTDYAGYGHGIRVGRLEFSYQ